MTIISIEEAGKYEGQEVTIRGWLYNLREAGKRVRLKEDLDIFARVLREDLPAPARSNSGPARGAGRVRSVTPFR